MYIFYHLEDNVWNAMAEEEGPGVECEVLCFCLVKNTLLKSLEGTCYMMDKWVKVPLER